MLLLAMIAREPGHAYEIVQRLKSVGLAVLDLPEGTVYPLLYKLEGDGSLLGRWRSSAGRQIKVYQITARGQRALATFQAQWDDLTRAVESVLSGSALNVGRRGRSGCGPAKAL